MGGLAKANATFLTNFFSVFAKIFIDNSKAENWPHFTISSATRVGGMACIFVPLQIKRKDNCKSRDDGP